ncbi:MAG TPA: MarR family transcriptional regulator [Chloroflexota bacterium]
MAVGAPEVPVPGSLRALTRALARTSAQHALFNQAVAAQLGIGPTDLDCLALLYDLGPATAGQLAEVLGLSTGAITGVVDRLVSAGFVQRESDPADRRRVIVQPVAERASDFEADHAPLLAAAAESVACAADVQQLVDFQDRVALLLGRETARIRGHASRSVADAAFTAPLGDLDAGVLEFASGAAEVAIRALDPSNGPDSADALYAARFEGVQPSVRLQAGTLSFRYRRFGPFEWGRTRHAGTVAVNASIPWSIAIRGGASGVKLDAASLLLRDVSIGGGLNRVELCLPRPSGTVKLCLDGGLNRVAIKRPFGVPAELSLRGGANRLEFDEQRFGAVGGDVRLASPEWELDANRYAIEVRGGASRLSIQETEPEEAKGVTRAHDI